jgi:hypothetical protein
MKCLTLFTRHNWGPWKVTDKREVRGRNSFTTSKGEWIPQGVWIVQARTCSKCGATEYNTQELSL